MRTTLLLDDDALDGIRAYARTNRMSLGGAASELVRRGLRYQLRTKIVNGLPVFEAPEEFPPISTTQVRDLLDEE